MNRGSLTAHTSIDGSIGPGSPRYHFRLVEGESKARRCKSDRVGWPTQTPSIFGKGFFSFPSFSGLPKQLAVPKNNPEQTRGTTRWCLHSANAKMSRRLLEGDPGASRILPVVVLLRVIVVSPVMKIS